MFLNIQYIGVPVISAYDISQYVESAGLNLSTTGAYTVLFWANDNLANLPSGTIFNVSGSGFWGPGSGYSFAIQNYFYDNFGGYQTGSTTGTFLSGNQSSGYNFFSPVQYTGFMTNNQDYFYDNFGSYNTGSTIQGSYLLTGNQVSGYFTYTPTLYSGLFNFITQTRTGSSNNSSSWYTVADSANPNYIWSGFAINVNPGAIGYLYIPSPSNNPLPTWQGPFTAGTTGNFTSQYPWTGGGPIQVGNIAIDTTFNGAFGIQNTGIVQLSGISTGALTGDFTINIIWAFNNSYNTSPNNAGAWVNNALDVLNTNPYTFNVYTGNNIGLQAGVGLTGGGYFGGNSNLTTSPGVSPNIGIISGGPSPSNLCFGPNFESTGNYFYSKGDYSHHNSVNQDTPLIDFDMLSGFAIYLYTSIWSGVTWKFPAGYGVSQQMASISSSYAKNSFMPTGFIYTGISSGLAINPYVYVLGNKISGSLVGSLAPTGLCYATGITSITGGNVNTFVVGPQTGYWTGWFGIQTGVVINGPMAQVSGFGFAMSQYLTVTRTGTFVSIYQSGVLYATGTASGQLQGTLPLKINQFNRQTGIFSGTAFSGFGLYHLDIYNYCQSQQTIQQNLFTYQASPQSGLIVSTNFVLK